MISSRNIKVVSLQLNNGFSGRAMASSKSDNVFSKADWIDCLCQPQSLFEETETILKTQGLNCVAVKKLIIGSKQIKVVIKHHHNEKGLRNFFRSLQPGKSIRNFKTAIKLINCNIPTAMPLAAIHKRENFLTKESIYITEYFENSCSLYDFANEKTNFKSRKEVCHQVADLLALLCKNGLWHRDAKASNFLVCKDNDEQYRVVLVDMDGIKRNIFQKSKNQLRCLWQLAASVMNVPCVNRSDYLRVFTAYCDLTDIAHWQRKQLFYQLAKKAKIKFAQKTAASHAASFKNILIIKPSSLGDIVLALPALSALRRNFPNAKISWLVRPEFEPLIKNHPHLTNTILFDRKLLGKWWCNRQSFSCLVSLIRQLRSSRFDAVFDFQGLFRTALFSWLSGCKKRFGMAAAREFGHIFYTHKITQNKASINLVDYYLKMVKTAGCKNIDVEFVLPQNQQDVDSANKLLTENGISDNNYAVLVPGSAHADKCWPIERFAVIAEKISSQFNMSIIATGTKSERAVVEKIKSICGVPIINLAGLTGIGELTAILKNAKIVISNDTGPGHIAAALDVPLVLIFGRSNPARVAPYGRGNCVAAAEPNSRGFKPDSTKSKHDIKAVTVDEVYRKISEQFENQPS